MRVLPLALLLVRIAAGADYPASAGYVNDFTGIVPGAVQQALELRVRAYERATSNEIAVAVVPSLDGQTVEEYARGLFRSWKIGKPDKNNGVLFLWAPTERRLRIEVGYGLENILGDQDCAEILNQATGLFRQGDYSAGVSAVVDGIIRRIGEAPVRVPGSERGHSGRRDLPAGLLVAVIALLAITLGVMHYHTTRVHQLQWEVPATIARAEQSLDEAAGQSAQAADNLDALRGEAPPEVWDGLAASLAVSPEHLWTLREELDRIKGQRREEYRELNSAHRALRRWRRLFERQTLLFASIGDTLKQLRASRDASLEQISRLPAWLAQMADRVAAAGGDERNAKLMGAAQDTFDRVRALRQHEPVNWLLAADLLADTEACLRCLDVLLDPEADARAKRAAVGTYSATRLWADSGGDSPAWGELAALRAVWNVQTSTYVASDSGGGFSSSAGGDSGAGGGGFGGGDTGGAGASAGY